MTVLFALVLSKNILALRIKLLDVFCGGVLFTRWCADIRTEGEYEETFVILVDSECESKIIGS